MKARLIRSFILLIPTVMIVSLLSFAVMYFAPGDAARLLLQEQLDTNNVTEKQADDYRQRLGIDKSFGNLYFDWLKGVSKGDLGKSLSFNKPVSEIFWSKYKLTLRISLLSVLFEILLAFPIALKSGMKPRGLADKFVNFWSVLTCSIPSFWIALIIVWILSVKLKWKYTIGYYGLKSLVVPVLIMSFLSAGNLARILRNKCMDVMREPYIEFARSYGLKSFDILKYHVLPHVLPVSISILVLDISNFLGGAVLVETIFNIPGFSTLIQKAVQIKDFTLISGSLFIIGIMICSLNIFADFIYPKLDSRNKNDINHKVNKRNLK